MDSEQEFAAWVEQLDRELQEWLQGLEAESDRVLAWLVEQAEVDPLEGFE